MSGPGENGQVGDGRVLAVARSAAHRFSKATAPSIRLLAGLGVEDDAHCGVTVKHRSRVARDPTQPNLRQVHLIHAELIEGLQARGFTVGPGTMGENITTEGLALLDLPTGARLRIGPEAVIEVTGLRNPCAQLDGYERGLTRAVLGKGPNGELIRKAGVMGVVIQGGLIEPGQTIAVELPAEPYRPLEPV
ncbi:MAG: MOSC domain-containing protein [Phenylobacterium sp.]